MGVGVEQKHLVSPYLASNVHFDRASKSRQSTDSIMHIYNAPAGADVAVGSLWRAASRKPVDSSCSDVTACDLPA